MIRRGRGSRRKRIRFLSFARSARKRADAVAGMHMRNKLAHMQRVVRYRVDAAALDERAVGAQYWAAVVGGSCAADLLPRCKDHP